MELEKALQGLILSKIADRKSPRTINVNQYGINKLIGFFDNPEIQRISEKDISDFFVHLRQESKLYENTCINIWCDIRVDFFPISLHGSHNELLIESI